MILRRVLCVLSIIAIAACDTRPIEEKVADAVARQVQFVTTDLRVPLLACETALAGGDWQGALTAAGYSGNEAGTLSKSLGGLGGGAILVDAIGTSSCNVTANGFILSEFSVFEQGVTQVLAERGQQYVGPAGTRMIFEKQGQRLDVLGNLIRGSVAGTSIRMNRL